MRNLGLWSARFQVLLLADSRNRLWIAATNAPKCLFRVGNHDRGGLTRKGRDRVPADLTPGYPLAFPRARHRMSLVEGEQLKLGSAKGWFNVVGRLGEEQLGSAGWLVDE